MERFISIVELGEDATDFAFIIGVRGLENHRYICESIDNMGNPIHGQKFCLEKSIDGLPANNAALQADVLKAWKSEQEKIRKTRERENINE